MRPFVAAVLAAAVLAAVTPASAQSYKPEFKNSLVVGPTGPSSTPSGRSAPTR